MNTPRTHFDEDIQRAEDLLSYAIQIEAAGADARLHQDVKIAAIGMSVGALDAYLCDKYVDCLTSALRAYSNGNWQGDLPTNYREQKLPAGEVLDRSRNSRPLWGIRMAARQIMERDNMLSISRIDEMFNPILPASHKLWSSFVPTMIDSGWRRLTGPYTNLQITAMSPEEKGKATKKVICTMKKRLACTIQIRHDWVHNCARPKLAIAKYSDGQASARIREIKEFITKFDDYIESNRRV